MPVWKVKEKTVGSNGLKTTRTVTTEDPNIVRSLIDAPKNNSSKANTTKSTPAAKPKKPKGLIAQLKDAVVAPKVEMPGEKKETKKTAPRLKKESKPKLEPPKAKAPAKPKALPAPKKEVKKNSITRKAVTGKAKINRTSGNLNSNQIAAANHHSFDGNRGTILKRDYERYRHKIEFSGLSNSQKKKLLDKLYKMYEPKLRYESQWYSPMVSGPAGYPQAKMDKIWERMMQANSDFVDWWKSIEPQLNNSLRTKEEKKAAAAQANEKELKEIKDNFDMWYKRALSDVDEYKKKNYPMKDNTNLCMAQSYLDKALRYDTKLYKEMFDKLNKLANWSKNSNVYKAYKLVSEGKLSSEQIQKQEAEDNKVIYTCADYTVRNISIKAGKRIGINFTFRPKPQLVYALKKRGFTWYSFEGGLWICKPEKFDLEWAKGISKQYEKYI